MTAARSRFDAGPAADVAIDLLAAAFDVGGLRGEEPSKSTVLAVARFHRERMQEIVSETPVDEPGSIPPTPIPSHDAKRLRLIRELLEAHAHATMAEQAYSDAIAERAWQSYAFGEMAKKNIAYAEKMREIQAWTADAAPGSEPRVKPSAKAQSGGPEGTLSLFA
jgi:hypothetical protein